MQQQNRQRVCKEHQEVIGNKMHFCFGKGFMMVGEVVGYRGGRWKFPVALPRPLMPTFLTQIP